MKLYELTEQYEALMDMLCDEEVDEQTIMDTLEAIDGEIEEKAENYAKIIQQMQADAAMLKAEEERLCMRRKSLENRSQNLKAVLKSNLEFIGKTKFKTALFSFCIATNGGKQPLFITDNIEEIPGKYLIPQPSLPDKEAIRELLASKEVEWAHLEPRGTSLRIR